MRRALPILIAVAALATANVAGADAQWGYALAHDLMSPFCPGRTLAQCPSPQADELRVWILTQEAAGATRAEVESMLIERFGEEILAAPLARGVRGFSAYAVPVAAFVLGGGFVAFALRRLLGAGAERGEVRPAPAAGPPVASDPELERLIDAELRD